MDYELTLDGKSLCLITPKFMRYSVKSGKLDMKFSCGDATLLKLESLLLKNDMNPLIIVLRRKIIGLL